MAIHFALAVGQSFKSTDSDPLVVVCVAMVTNDCNLKECKGVDRKKKSKGEDLTFSQTFL